MSTAKKINVGIFVHNIYYLYKFMALSALCEYVYVCVSKEKYAWKNIFQGRFTLLQIKNKGPELPFE